MRDKHGVAYKPKQRNSNNRERRCKVLIVAEGKNKTETKYFRELKREYNLNLSFVSGDYTDPVNMVNALIKEVDNDYGDIGFCLIDSDFAVGKNEQIARADKMAAKCKVNVIVSSPCFEIWLLCHFNASTKQYRNFEEVFSALRKELPGYTKNADGVFSATKDKLKDAMQNAQKLRENCERNGYSRHTVEFLPSTEVDVMLKQFIK